MATLCVVVQGAEKYAGEYALGQPNGVGVLVYANGDKHAGQYQAGLYDGHGVFQFSDGETYYGMYKAGEPHGLGVYAFANGDVYSGSYRRGEKDGFGVYKTSTGAVTFDLFREDVEQSSVPFDATNPQHARLLGAAQAAQVRRVASRWLLLRAKALLRLPMLPITHRPMRCVCGRSPSSRRCASSSHASCCFAAVLAAFAPSSHPSIPLKENSFRRGRDRNGHGRHYFCRLRPQAK
jgi:hypothetical protein